MPSFKFQPRVGDSDKISAGLGTTGSKFTDKDLNKVVKLGADHNYVAVAAADEIEGIVVAVAPHTVNQGYAFGTVQTGGRVVAKVNTATAVAVRDFVVASAQAAVGTEQEYPLVQKAADSNQVCKWRVIDLLDAGTGAQNTLVLIERV